MPKKSQKGTVLNKKVVFAAAREIAQLSEMPTNKKIRAKLGGCGSETTIQKYRAQWEKELLKLAAKMSEESFQNVLEMETWLDEKQVLEQTLTKEVTQNKVLANELIKSEKENMQFKEHTEVLEKDLKELNEKHQILTLKHEHLEKLCLEIRAERELMVATLLQDKNKQIESLQQELRETHQESLEKIKTIGFQGDDALIQEKVKIIHLEDQVKILKEQVSTLEAQLQTQKEANHTLIQQMTKQREYMQKTLSWEQLQQYETGLKEG